MSVGILFGLGAATFQATSYFFSRMYVVKRDRAVIRLLVLAHIMMGIIAAGILPLAWPAGRMPPMRSYVLNLIGIAGFYLLGQVGLFLTLRTTDASRVSPLLGLKILILAVISAVFLGKDITFVQWVAVSMSVAAAFTLNFSGERIPLLGIAGILLTCLFYSLSDLNIRWTTDILTAHGLGTLHASVLALSMCYVLSGAVGMLFLPLSKGAWKMPAEWKYSAPFALSWFAGMAFLFATFATVGVILGNIMQSLRGLISVVVGAWLARRGLHELETDQPGHVWLRRGAAAVMMCAAISLYVSSEAGWIGDRPSEAGGDRTHSPEAAGREAHHGLERPGEMPRPGVPQPRGDLLVGQ